MKQKFSLKKRFALPSVLAAVILSAVSCFDMYGGVLDNSNPDNYRISFVLASSPDILLVNDGEGNLTQAPAAIMPVVASTVEYAAASDFDNDGDPDIIVITNSPDYAYILKNNDRRYFSVAGSITIHSTARRIALADFNHDGNIEAYLACYSANDQILTIDQNLNLSVFSDTPGSSNSATVCAFDSDNDGNMDVFLGNFSGNNQVRKNDGHGNFSAVSWSESTGYNTGESAAGDLNNDGYTDIFELNEGHGFTVKLSDGHGSLNTGYEYTTTPTTLDSIKLGDFNGDGSLDAVATWEGGIVKSKIMINDGNGNFSVSDWDYAPADVTTTAVCDIDGDFDLDIIAIIDGFIVIGINDGEGNFTFSNTGYNYPTSCIIAGNFIR